MIAAVVLLIIVAVCTLRDNNPADQRNLTVVKQMITSRAQGTTETVQASAHLGLGTMSPMLGLQNNLTQFTSIMNSLRQIRDRVPNAVSAALPPA